MLNAIILLAQQKGQEAAQDGFNPWGLTPFILMIVLFYFMLIAPQRRERRLREEMLTRLKKNDRVITNSGIFGYVVNIKDEEVTLRIDDNSNARLTVLKGTIGRILTQEDQAAKETTDKSEASENVKAGASPKK
ncbi:MAG: preprotein translocase subunit YajC [Gemmataceae bacterium]|nr:preprotein translocase subunit YajC [Gemmataceae bacterium]